MNSINCKNLIFLVFLFTVSEAFGVYNYSIFTFDETGCSCYKYTCGCCAHLEVPKTYLNDTGCVNLTYLPNDYGLSFTVTIDNKTIYNETISVHNPPPICFRAPHLKKYTDVCIRFYDLQVSKHKLHGCVELEARLHEVILATYKLGCFNLGHGSFSLPKKPSRKKTIFVPKISKLML
ncbi:uncharacterized protein LOC111636110 [Centruroides sculpturatus]|uniref:uncharacterized protein LOC111636110 n=1 Tax=Centruroides sculpturatus TaxID=218467 RepID=UPI000C6D70AC|nr:uncharacterized protein LOC111636110 [Centruroides sculpturatus]